MSECILGVTHLWFQKAVPEPSIKNQRVQLGVHFEEIAEMLDVLHSSDAGTQFLIAESRNQIRALATRLKKVDTTIETTDYVMFLDALCDQIVTATGTAYMNGLDILGGMREVNGSNHSKFVNGEAVFDANGKIAKGPDYYEADLSPFI
jgi:predicted HAD superfamily Cof-like phosphohydrolase